MVPIILLASTTGFAQWQLASIPGFGDPLNEDFNLFVIGGELYATTDHMVTGAQVWQYECGTNWTQLYAGIGEDPETLLGFGDGQ